MKIKKSISLLLVFALIFTLFSTMSVITPFATEGESTETTNYNTKVVHIARGSAESNATSRAVLFKIADKADIVAGETYTVKMAYTGSITMTGSSQYLGVRVGAGGTPNLTQQNNSNGTKSNGHETNFTAWTVDITPTASKDIYACFYTGNNKSTADGYVGAIHVINSNGEDVAIDLSNDTGFYNSAHVSNANFNTQSDETAPTSKYYETTEVLDIDTLTDAALKQRLINAFVEYEEGSMINFTPGASPSSVCFYRKISADKLTANTTYKLSVKYSGIAFGSENKLIVRNSTLKIGTDNPGSLEVLSSASSGEVINHRNYKEYVNYYTAPETTTDLYIGFYVPQSKWKNLEFNIGEIQLTDAAGNNVLPSLDDMSEFYKSFSGGAISKLDSSYSYYIIKRQALDNSIFCNTQTEQKQVVNIEKDGGNSCRVYVRVCGVLPGDYQVHYETKGLTYNYGFNASASAQVFDVITTTAGAYNTETPVKPELTKVDHHSHEELTYSFSVTDGFKDVYIGFYVHPNTVNGFNYFIENLTLKKIDENGVAGENLIDPDLYVTTWYRHSNSTSATNPWTKFSLTDGTGSYNVITVTLMDDEDERYTSLFDSPHANIKIQKYNQGYAKKAVGLSAGTYRVTVIEHGADIKNKGYPHVVLKYGATGSFTELTTRNADIRENCVEKVEGTNATYKFTYDVVLSEGQDTVGTGIYNTDSLEANIYITELSLYKVEDGEIVGENLFTPLYVRDWCDTNGNMGFYDNYDGYYGYSNKDTGAYRGIKYRDTKSADANKDDATDIVDLFILSKLQDAGIELTTGTNDLVTVRNTLLNPITE